MDPEELEQLRAAAQTLLTERYNGNQTAFARDLGIRSSNIKRFVIDKAGGISRQTAQKLSALLRSKPPQAKPAAPPSKRPGAMKDAELEKTLDFFADRWEPITGDVGRAMVKHLGVTRSRSEWIEVLDEVETCLEDLIKKYK